MPKHPLTRIPQAFHSGQHLGITSVCSAHPIVIKAALLHGLEHDAPVLIEATCNQVNQDGGYTGMTPAGFRDFVHAIAADVGFDTNRIILGGDHLGPNPWKHLCATEAMDKAEAMIIHYAQAGFTKLHLDTSMGCAGEPVALDDATTATRAARLALAAEAQGMPISPVYIIGTEVPVPGGATHGLDALAVTAPTSVRQTLSVHKRAFCEKGLEAAFDRVIGIVVQPGVEFGHSDVIHFTPDKAIDLSAALRAYPQLVFEAHSTDYQTAANLRALVGQGFSILKVGPWLTYALREALYGLDAIADTLDGHAPQNRLMLTMEQAMQDEPKHWAPYYSGSDAALWRQRHFSLSDRIRYYWGTDTAQRAVRDLLQRLGERPIPAPLSGQYLGALSLKDDAPDAESVLLRAVTDVLRLYHAATQGT